MGLDFLRCLLKVAFNQSILSFNKKVCRIQIVKVMAKKIKIKIEVMLFIFFIFYELIGEFIDKSVKIILAFRCAQCDT
jgi:hypothetical protein